jgi:hypothetical protein
MATQVSSSSSEDEGVLGGAGNVQISRKFSVADYSDVLSPSGILAAAPREAAPSSVLSHEILRKLFAFLWPTLQVKTNPFKAICYSETFFY